MKRIIKKIYRDVKFPSERRDIFDRPNFANPTTIDKDGNEVTSQAVQICNYILKQMRKYFFI